LALGFRPVERRADTLEQVDDRSHLIPGERSENLLIDLVYFPVERLEQSQSIRRGLTNHLAAVAAARSCDEAAPLHCVEEAGDAWRALYQPIRDSHGGQARRTGRAENIQDVQLLD
jgi:superfamily II DNA helicase RecQ